MKNGGVKNDQTYRKASKLTMFLSQAGAGSNMMQMLKDNKPLRMYVITGASDKLAQQTGSQSIIMTLMNGRKGIQPTAGYLCGAGLI